MKTIKNICGYTFLELLISMAILGLLAVLSLPSLTALSANHRLEGAAQRMVSDLRLARRTAISERKPITVTLDPDNDRYMVEEGTGLNPDTAIQTDFRDPRQGFMGVDLVGSSRGTSLTFSPRGTTHSWTTITLRNPRGKEQKITLIGTGRVKRRKE